MKQQREFKRGDIVRLKVGSPDMVVVKRSSIAGILDDAMSPTHGWIDCTWFKGKKCEERAFDPESLEHVKPASEKSTPPTR